ncbi:MAG: LUD domain-containing protein [Candidatus Eremiobacteraeota bacterium]|nr:LUD domain-containing protein [Candidatus Eremiobacteraeota bacterium]
MKAAPATPDNGRAAVLGAVAAALRRHPGTAELPPAAALDAAIDAPADATGSETSVDTFVASALALGASVSIVADVRACASLLARDLLELGCRRVAVQSSPLAAVIAQRLVDVEFETAREMGLSALEAVPCGIIEARAFFADTGCALVLADNTGDRVLPYLPRTSCIVGTLARVHASLENEALAELHAALQSGMRGEALIVGGPSRTADIEKILIMGAHGPAEVRIYLLREAGL